MRARRRWSNDTQPGKWQGASGLVLVSRIGDVGSTESHVKVPNTCSEITQKVSGGDDSRTVAMEVGIR